MKSRKSVELNERLSKRWLGYAAAAGAAGVSMFAVPSPAAADIIYTPADIVIPHDGIPVPIDFGHGAAANFSLWIRSYVDFGPFSSDLFLYGRNAANLVIGQGQGFAARLAAGATIGAGQKFAPTHRTFGIPLIALKRFYSNGTHTTCTGPWAQPARSGYLGLEFDISGQEHFGWARLNAGCLVGGRRVGAILTGYAF
ncbi:MAG TPA: hypothetical protein VGR48_05640, partial [Terriglobales bacterium]|nr:hypothetical protein [Terriglobales bacterium]